MDKSSETKPDVATEAETDCPEENEQQNDAKKDLNTIPLTLSDADIERAASDLGIEGKSIVSLAT